MRKQITLDERDIEIIAEARKKTKPLFKNISIFGFVMIVIGGIMEVNGNWLGFLIMVAGSFLIAFGVIYSQKYFKKSKKEFLEHVKKYNQIPSWPDDPEEEKTP